MKKLTSLFVALAILFSTTLTSCLGSFAAFNGLKDWNQDITDNKFVNQLVFWALNIVPVYGLFMAGDVIIFNLIEFWTGNNPIAMNSGEIQQQNIAFNGQNYIMTATKNKMTVANAEGEVLSELNYDQNTRTWFYKKNEESKAVLTFSGIEGQLATYKVYNSECSEGQEFAINTQDLNFQKNVMVW